MPAIDVKVAAPRRPLHPPVVHAPIGALVVAVVCDLVSIVGGSSHEWAHTWFKGASCALAVGMGSLVVAAVTGFIDRAGHTASGSRQRVGVARHAAAMTLAAIVCVWDLILRSTPYDSAQHTPAALLVLTLLALALATAGGELGGRLVYIAGVGVRPRTPEEVADGARSAVAGGPGDQRPATMRTAREPADTRAAADKRAAAPPLRVRLAMTLVAWLVAFGVVMTLLALLGRALPLPLRALLISGVLVMSMTNFVLPALRAAASRWHS